jgi:signal-transduction protein with cAMP-binding, CBS, and nucleotidyltransferase domain
MPLFKGVPNRTLKAIVPLFRLEEHASNAKIFDYGAPGDKMYILIQGSITLQKQDGTYLATLTAQVIACDGL